MRRFGQDTLREPPFEVLEIGARGCVPSPVFSVPLSPVDLGLILFGVGNFEVNAGIGSH